MTEPWTYDPNCWWWITTPNPTGLPPDLVDKWRAAGREVFHGTWEQAAELSRARMAAGPQAAPAPAAGASGPAETPKQLTLFEAA